MCKLLSAGRVCKFSSRTGTDYRTRALRVYHTRPPLAWQAGAPLAQLKSHHELLDDWRKGQGAEAVSKTGVVDDEACILPAELLSGPFRRLRRLPSENETAEAARQWAAAKAQAIPDLVHQSRRACQLSRVQATWRARCQSRFYARFALWSDAASRQLVASACPAILALYDRYPRGVAARLCYLYAFGGVHMDLNVTCLRPLSTLPLAAGQAIFGLRDGFVAAPPGHPFLGYAMALMARLEPSNGMTMRPQGADLDVSTAHMLGSTGPNARTHARVLTRAIREYPWGDIVVHPLSRIHGTERDRPHPCGDGAVAALEGGGCARALPKAVTTSF